MNLSRHGRRGAWCMASVMCLNVGLMWAGVLCAQEVSVGEVSDDFGFDAVEGSIVGFVQPSKQVVVSAPLAGIVERIMVEDGSQVKSGAAVAQMDDGIQASQLEISKLEVEQQQIVLNEAELEYEKAVDLEKKKALTEWELRVEKVRLEGARIALRYAQKKVARDEVMLKRYRMLAPFSGEVLRVVAEEGETVEQGEDILLLVSMKELEAHIGVPMDLYGKLKVGKDYKLVVDLPEGVEGVGADKVLGCVLKFHEPNINFASRTFQCVFTIKNPGGKLPFGFRVRLIRPE